MRFNTLHGGAKRVRKVRNYRIDWDKSSRSKRQFAVKQFLKKHWKSHILFEEMPVAGTKMTLDFYNATKKIAIEVQGVQHTRYVPHFHKNQKMNFLSQKRRDKEKAKFCELNDIKLMEIHESDVIGERLFKKFNITL
ncbi:hypothetical protein CMO96_01815 [Candidatus Woesebacteria bacterium]|nr:hypothetical protein [Candidatus Woesebacteria bacterium]